MVFKNESLITLYIYYYIKKTVQTYIYSFQRLSSLVFIKSDLSNPFFNLLSSFSLHLDHEF